MEIKRQPISYKTKISKWGNSNGLRIPQEILDEVNIRRDDEVDLIVDQGELVIKKRNVPSSLEELFKNYDSAPFHSGEVDWGEARGNEYW